jgi:hypothetical protein
MRHLIKLLGIPGTLLFAVFFTGSCLATIKADTTSGPVDTRLSLNYLNLSNDSVNLTAVLSIRRNDNTLNLENATIAFSASGEGSPQDIGKATTNQEGIASLTIHVGQLKPDKEGLITYTAAFTGNEHYTEATAEARAKPARIKLFFIIIDSIKTLKVTATQINSAGNDAPIPGETVMIYVPRLFSLLKIGEISLDDTGEGTIEFPKGIVGDTLGNLTVLARIEEHDQFGFVQGKNTINWGVPKQYYKAEVPSRELWTPIAPLWMIITLIIMLLGVWAHYVYAIYELVMIKKISKKPQPGNLT